MLSSFMWLQLIISALIIIVVLLQFGKGAEAGLMGGGASDAVFSGAQKGNILSKITVVLAVAFLLNSIWLSKLQKNRTASSVMDGVTPISAPLNSDAAKKAPVKKEEAKKATETKSEKK